MTAFFVHDFCYEIGLYRCHFFATDCCLENVNENESCPRSICTANDSENANENTFGCENGAGNVTEFVTYTDFRTCYEFSIDENFWTDFFGFFPFLFFSFHLLYLPSLSALVVGLCWSPILHP